MTLMLKLFQLHVHASFGHVILYTAESVWNKTCRATLALSGIGRPMSIFIL